MDSFPLEALRAQIAPITTVRPLGRIRRVDGHRVWVTGLNQDVQLGDEVLFRAETKTVRAEIVGLFEDHIEAMPYGTTTGLTLGQLVEPVGPPLINPCETWLGRIIDPFGVPLDDGPIRHGPNRLIHTAPPSAGRRNGFGNRLQTGYVALDTVLPLAEGQRMGIFAGSGVGKSRLLGDLAKDMDADIVVVALVGERGREVASFARDVLGSGRMGRAVIVAATSDRPANVRRRAIPAALAIAEFFRDSGARVLFLCDSLTRHAEAYRDIVGGASGDLPTGLVSDIAALVERAGPGVGRQRSITALFSVLVAGSDMEEPIADTVRGLLDGHIVLAREIAEAGRFPAIDVLASTSRSLPEAATPAENKIIQRLRTMLELYARNKLMITSGLYERGADAQIDEVITKISAIEHAICGKSGSVQDSFTQISGAMG